MSFWGQSGRVTALALIAASAAACSHIHMPLTRAQIEKTPNPCVDFTASLYFERSSAKVTREAKDVLQGARAQTKGCLVSGVEVVGLADAVGAPDANLELSKKRALSVTAALAHAGFRDVTISAVAVGEAGSANAAGAVPLRRRADVIFHVSKQP
jgi:peptidoglycan-associated lipoprotein